MNGGLVVFEGSDGTGKSALSNGLVERLRSSGFNVLPLSFPGRSEGTIGRTVYDIHHHAEKYGISAIDPTALQCLHIAAHLDAITTRILPAVDQGRLVVLDRFWWSTLVYGLVGGANRSVISKLIEAEVTAWDRLFPKVLFLVDREQPLRAEPMDTWNACRAEYLSLASSEARNYPVRVISNNATEDEALEHAFEQFIKLT
jgi:thymidylate kinase